MKRILITGLALAAAAATLGSAVAQSTSNDSMNSPMKSMGGMKMGQTFKLGAQNDSGENGTATLTQTADGLVVKLALTGGTGDQPAHIHKGTCDKLDPKPAYPLTTVSDGTSTTTLKDVKLSELTSGTYAINVHKSTTDIKTYVACGNLTVAAAK
jgi:hypothetical protein